MSKRALKNILITVFLLCTVLLFYTGIKQSLQNNDTKVITTDMQTNTIYDEPSTEVKLASTKPEETAQAVKELLITNKSEKEINSWKAIERKDSYNNELQYYSKNNVDINENIIIITSIKEPRESKMYTSGLAESSHAYKYGFYEFIIQTSKGSGLFPAIWLMPDNGERLPEVDIFEMIGSKPEYFYGVTHFNSNGNQDRDYFKYKVPKKAAYKVALEWKVDCLIWYIDNKEIYRTTKGVPNIYMYIIINQAIGGDWPGDPDENTVFPNQFKVFVSKIDPHFKKGRY